MPDVVALTDTLATFWAKLADGGESPGYHPLICHMLDVAAVTEKMWELVLPEAAQNGLAQSLGFGDDIASAKTWIAFLAGCHDLGKCSPSFANKKAATWLHSWYREMDGDCVPAPAGGSALPLGVVELAHGTITAATLPGILCSEYHLDPLTATILARVTGGHHGTFEPDALRHVRGGPSIAVGRGHWPEARAGLVRLLGDTLGVSRDRPPGRPDAGGALALAGYISVADWIGSNDDATEGFPHLQHGAAPVRGFDAKAYLEQSHGEAERALAWAGWTGWRQPDTPAVFQDLFPFSPNAVQQAAIELGEEIAAAGEPALVIVEAPMGEGKTEAALWLADRWGVVPGPRGLYFALPTMATSNQMFGRLQEFLRHRYPDDAVNVQLLHGRASLLDEVQALRDTGRDLFLPRDVYDGDVRTGIGAARWFASAKRGLLAPFAAGTVDQLLLAVLRTRHVFVRLFGVHCKTVIVDEVHAYDTYMSTLLENVLAWLAALGSPVVLLSATLPADRRHRLLEAYKKGLEPRGPAAEAPPATPYPRLSWITAAGGGGRAIVASGMRQKRLLVRLIDDAMPHVDGTCRLADWLEGRLQAGGCVAVVCNTVGRAQALYAALRRRFPPEAGEAVVRLFHARHRFLERSATERLVLAAFGKPNPVRTGENDQPIAVMRPRKAIVVSTQVLEQSLDLDFDLLVSDFAPADLLLQRSGREHRHERGERPGFDPPELWLLGPETYDDGVPRFDRGSRYVYAEQVLLRTWLSLQARGLLGPTGGFLAVPDEVEALVEATYGERTTPDVPNGAWAAALAESKRELEAIREHEIREAKARWTPRPNRGLVEMLQNMTSDYVVEDETDVHERFRALTRLAPPGVTLVLLRPDELEDADRLTATWRGAVANYRRHLRTPGEPAANRRAEKTRLDAARNQARLGLERFMLERAIEVTRYDVVRHWQAQAQPEFWAESPALSHARRIDLVAMDGALRHAGGGPMLTLDADFGLIVTAAAP